MEGKNYTIIVDNSNRNLNQIAKKRCFEAIKESGIIVSNMESVTREEALENVIDGLGWRNFLENGGMGWHYFEGLGSYEELFEMTKQLVQEIIQQ